MQSTMTASSEYGRVQDSEFKPAWWLGNRHWQTIYPSFPWSVTARVALRSETLDLPDGDSTVVDWLADVSESGANDMPLLIILHGLESSAEATYAQMLLSVAQKQDWNACVLHFRDCGDYRNKLPRRYHAGETNDIRYFLEKLITDGQTGPICAAGYSLGGNVLLKYLGENGSATPLHAVAAVSVPLDLAKCATALNSGFSKVYQRHLLKRMKVAVRRKFNPYTAAFNWNRAMAASTFAEFDDAVTAPLHGFNGIEDYYSICSSARYLKSIAIPTLIVNSRDDPFMTPDIIPDATMMSASVTIEASARGGHVGFIEGGHPFRPRYYLPNRIIGYLSDQLDDSGAMVRAMPGL